MAATHEIRWVRRLLGCRRMPLQKIESLRQLVAAEEKMTTSKPGWITFGVDPRLGKNFCLRTAGPFWSQGGRLLRDISKRIALAARSGLTSCKTCLSLASNRHISDVRPQTLFWGRVTGGGRHMSVHRAPAFVLQQSPFAKWTNG